MPKTVVTPSPGFISIAVSDAQRSAAFYEEYLGAIRDTFDFGPDAVAFVGWPTFAVSSARRPGEPGPSPETTSIQLWWRASDAQALYEKAVAAGIRIPTGPATHWCVGLLQRPRTTLAARRRREHQRPPTPGL
jgi:catechol 2,3-dioxygenase-like lactoylglutathione lyase family enzyme